MGEYLGSERPLFGAPFNKLMTVSVVQFDNSLFVDSDDSADLKKIKVRYS